MRSGCVSQGSQKGLGHVAWSCDFLENTVFSRIYRHMLLMLLDNLDPRYKYMGTDLSTIYAVSFHAWALPARMMRVLFTQCSAAAALCC